MSGIESVAKDQQIKVDD